MKLKFLGYTLFIAACIFFSLYVRFPGETAARYLEHTLSQLKPNVTLEIDTVHPSFPPGITADAVHVYYAGSPIATLNRVTSFVDMTSLFGTPVTGSFKASVFDGILSGVMHVSRETPWDIHVETELKEVKLRNVPLGKSLSDSTLSGILNGTLTTGFKQRQLLQNEGDLTVSNLVLQFPDPLFSIEAYAFSSGTLKFSMPQDHTFRVDDFSVTGRQLDLHSSGEIRVAEIFQNSRLNLTARVVLHPLFFMNAGDSVPIDVSTTDADNAVFHLRIGGTLHQPTIAMDPGGK